MTYACHFGVCVTYNLNNASSLSWCRDHNHTIVIIHALSKNSGLAGSIVAKVISDVGDVGDVGDDGDVGDVGDVGDAGDVGNIWVRCD